MKTALAKFIEAMTKSAIIRKQKCTDSDGNSGEWVVMDSKGNKVLGCHSTKSSAKDQLQAIEANK